MNETSEVSDGIYDAFERVVAQHGDRRALHGIRACTYAQLHADAQFIAAKITACADASRPVLVIGPTEARTVALLLGALAAGRIVGVLNMNAPDDQLREQIAVVDSRILCVTADQRSRIASLGLADGISVIDDRTDEGPRGPISSRRVRPGDPAILVFTSGSTGRSKAVLQTHERYCKRARQFETTGVASLMLWQSPAFSHGMNILMQCLLSGSAGYFYDLHAQGLYGLSAWLNTHGIEQIELPMGIMRDYFTLLEQGAPVPPLRRVRLGGVVYGRDLRRARALLHPETLLVTRYSATETSMLTERVWAQTDALPDDQEIAPVGFVLPGRMIEVRDEHGRSVAPGQTGHIFVRTPDLALAYYDNPEATAKRFHVVDEAGTREYDTGDLGSFGADGQLRVHGRVDGVVKVRGVRIGLHEVDGALESLPQVQHAVTYVLTKDGEEELGSALVLHAGAELDMQQLREALRKVLPESMIPSDVRVAAKLPQTTTSKIDRNAARDAALGLPQLAAHTVGRAAPPRGEVEEQLARIWTSVLGVSVNDRHADFFALGGHSLKAMRLIAETEKRFGVTLTLTELVQGPTLLEQAVLVRERRGRAGAVPAAASTLTTYSSQGSGAPIFVIPPNNGTAMAQIPLAKALGSGRPIHLLQPPGWSPGEKPASTVEALAHTYLQDVQQAAAPGSVVLIAICGGMRAALVMAQRMQEQRREPELVVLLDPPAGRMRMRPRHRLTLGDHLHEITAMARHRQYGQLRARVLGGMVRTLLRPFSARHRRMHEMFVATSEATWRYEQQPYSGRVLIVTSEERDRLPDERQRWGTCYTGRCDVESVPGCTHRDVVVGAAAAQVAAVIERALTQS